MGQGISIITNLSIYPNISEQFFQVSGPGTLDNGSSTSDQPSNFLNVIVPYNSTNTNSTGVSFACSVDARWAVSNYAGGPSGDQDADYVQTVSVKNSRPWLGIAAAQSGYQYNFLPADDGTWRRVKITTDWLISIPASSVNRSMGGVSVLGALLQGMGLDNRTGTVVEWVDVVSSLESVIAVLYADALSRQGFFPNGGNSSHFTDPADQFPWDNSYESQSSLLAGKYKFTRPAGPATRLEWSIVVSGYAYRADSVAYYLALTVLFLHAAMALVHVLYLLHGRLCSSSWDSVTGLIVLAATSFRRSARSNTADHLGNTSVGVERYRTLSTGVRVRTLPTSGITPARHDNLKILFGDDGMASGYEKVAIGNAYG